MSDAGHESDLDSTSLFGSPPPSPTLGRSTTLALPGTSSAGNENVGTIALPGSHNYSELPVSLPVLPAPVATASSRARSQPHGHAPSCIPAKRKKAQSTKSTKSKQTSEPPPLISLNMELGDAPPVGFLRNQQALLGIAGLVGRVVPSKLPKERKRGISPSDPIIVEDIASPPKSIARNSNIPTLDPKKLPVPQVEAIITTLVNQGNIFAVLKSLLVLLGQSPSASTQARLRRFGQPPPKRRRSDVPAGAVDWDVPYPFAAGEGPNNYHENWHTQRKRQLMVQLISLIKEAIEKATTKLHIEKAKSASTEITQAQAHMLLQAHAHAQTQFQVPVQTQSIHHGATPVQPPSALKTPSRAPHHSLCATNTDPLVIPITATDISIAIPTFPSDFSTSVIDPTSQSSSESLHDDLAWLFSNTNFVEQFSVPNNDGSSVPTSSSSTRLSTPLGSGTSAADTPLISQTSNDIFNDPAWSSDFFDTIDTSLWDMGDLGTTPDLTQPAFEEPAVNISSSSTLPFSSSMDTDAQQIDTLDTLVIASPDTLQYTNQPHSACTNTTPNNPNPISFADSHPSFAPTNRPPEHHPPPKPPQKTIAPASPLPLLRATQGSVLDRDSILKHAKRRREQLAAEIAKAKMELWETTMEQAVLVNLTKDPKL